MSLLSSKLFICATVLCLLFAWLWSNHIDIIITLAPKHVDFWLLQKLYLKGKKNTGLTRVPMISNILPVEGITKDNLGDIIHPLGLPTLVKGVLKTDQDLIVSEMTKRNKGKNMRMLNFDRWEEPHFSPSCSAMEHSITRSFDDYSTNHLFANKSDNHSYYYAGFESITDPKTINDITGLEVETLGSYKQNNLFTSNFPREILTAPLHCAPIDSLTLQLIGTKTWFFVSPEDLATIDSIPMPTSFPLPLTDDEMLSRIKNIYVLKQEPGDAMYFGPHWCHAVSTSPGPNLMMNMRYFNLKKILAGPIKLAAKILFRQFLSNRGVGLNPQDNKLLFPGIYDALNNYYNEKCGESVFFKALHKAATAVA